jgi:integrative and conjugative element protein (TIGR02256 family)
MTEDMVFIGYGLTISVDRSVWSVWQDGRQVYPNAPESFGVIIGSCEKTSDSCRIERVTVPGKRDVQSRSHFILKDPCHQKAVELAFRQSDGYFGYLGTWHTHPVAIPTPSTVDQNDWLLCSKRNPDRRLYFVIVGTEKTCIYIKHDKQFKMLKEQRSNKS